MWIFEIKINIDTYLPSSIVFHEILMNRLIRKLTKVCFFYGKISIICNNSIITYTAQLVSISIAHFCTRWYIIDVGKNIEINLYLIPTILKSQ